MLILVSLYFFIFIGTNVIQKLIDVNKNLMFFEKKLKKININTSKHPILLGRSEN